MSAHTPGPWRVQHCSDDDLLNIVSDAVDYPIADLGSVDADDYPAETIDRLYADAHLIAAAPKLLLATKTLIEIAMIADEMLDAVGKEHDEIKAAIQLARQFVADAEGQS